MSEGTQRSLAAIVSADVVGYSRLMGQDAAGTLTALRQLRTEIFAPTVGDYQGRIVKSMGDGWLVEFASVADAVACAIEVQEQLIGNDIIKLRIGVHLGDITHENEDIYGDGVNIAARLQEIAEPGAMVISDIAWRSIDGKLSAAFADLGGQDLKNIAKPVAAFGWGMTAVDEGRALSPPDKPSIAVLPFDNMSDDPEQEYFADGIAEDVITDLSKIAGLFVIARNSSFTYKGNSVDVKRVAEELNVRYVLEGSVRKAADRVRITAQLIEGASAGHLWAERYDRVLDDLFGIQDEITRHIVEALRVELDLGESERVGGHATSNVEAYDIALRARSLLLRFTPEAAAEAAKLYERSIDLDPKFITAISGLAGIHFNSSLSGWSDDPAASLNRGCELAERAFELGPEDLQANWVLALAHLWRHELDEAIEAIDRAVRLGPNDAEAHATRGYILSYAGRSQDAVSSLQKSMRLDPSHPGIWLHFLAHAYFVGDNFEEAVSTLRRRINRQPETDISRVLLASCYGHLGHVDQARAEWAEALRYNPDYSLERKRSQLPYKYTDDWRRFVDGLRKAGLPE
jgi:adenylate cyclase